MIDPALLTPELVRIPNCDPPGGELAVAQLVARRCDKSGFRRNSTGFCPAAPMSSVGYPGVGKCLRW
jgi:hypothetical protein